MIIYPLLEILDGRCVSLFRGRMDQPSIWHVDPVEKVNAFASAGAEWIHITDFDAMSGDTRNEAILEEIIQTSSASIQLGGGFRSLTRIEEWIDKGLGRAVVGTLAVQQPDIVKEAARLYPDQIVVSIDVYQGKVVGEGWRTQSAFRPEEIVDAFEGHPLAAIVVTDIDADLEEAEDSLALITEIAGRTNTPVIARGLSRSLDDISRMKYVPFLTGAVVGRALFDRTIELADALELAKPEAEKRAPFI